MRVFAVRRALVGVCAVAALLVLGVGTASAQQFHGIAFTKGCQPNTAIGQPLMCAFQILNLVDGGQDTLQISNVTDVVNSAGGAVNSGNILGALQLVFSSPTVSCTGGSGAGTAGSPYVGATQCTLPFGTSIQTNSFSHYTVQAADIQLPGHSLTDSATLGWNNTCTSPTVQNCTTGPQQASAGSATNVQQIPSTTATAIHNAAHAVVTTVDRGTTVHDFVTVAGLPGQPVPTGNVIVNWFLNGDCSGNPAATSGPVGPLDANGQFDATAFAFTVNSAGPRAFQAVYPGDSVYLASTGACEPLAVVDANIQITPQQATNPINSNHTLTGHVNVDATGAGLANAPDGTVINFTIVAGPGSFVGPSSCTTPGGGAPGSGSCTVVITSANSGTTVVKAATDVTVGGLTIHRETGDGLPGDSSNANKTWVRGAISIAPSATNEVGHAHVFTVTVAQDPGTGSFALAPNVPVTVTCTAQNGALPQGPFTGTTNASGTVLVTVNSPTTGSLTCSASGTLTLGNPPTTFTVTTDGVAPNSGPATKTWVNANIQISPQQATNPVGSQHIITGHVNVDTGNGAGLVNAPDGTVITFTLSNAGGATATFVGPSSCTTPGAGAPGSGSCTVIISSPTAGTTTIHASTNVSVGGVALARATGDGLPGDSPDATKIWLSPNANIQISPPTASNAIGTNHTLTGHVNISTDNVNFTPAPAGTVINFTLTNSNGATATFVGGVNSCTTVGATGSCTVAITSPTPGTTVVHASTDVTVSGTVLHRETDGVAPNSGDANKNWVDANIQVTPATANNPVGTNHTITGHVNVNPGTGFVNAPDGTVITFSLSNAGGASAVFVPAGGNTCTTPGAGAPGSGSCTVVISSPTAGTTTVSASTTVSVNGVSLTRTTNATGANSGPAVKTWSAAVVTTRVLDPNGVDLTNNQQVTPGTIVHDEATVAKAPGTPAGVPAPTGTVTFSLFANGNCTAPPQSTDPNEPLNAAGVATSVTFTTPAAGGSFSYRAQYSGDANYPPATGPCEPFTVSNPFAPALTPGFWKNHQAATTALLPITLGNYNVNTFAKASAIFDAMKCSAPIDCLAAHELAAKLDVKSGSNPVINPVLAQADALLIQVNYNGPGNYTPPTAAQKALALQLESIIDTYTNA
jgi:hypothetical protein